MKAASLSKDSDLRQFQTILDSFWRLSDAGRARLLGYALATTIEELHRLGHARGAGRRQAPSVEQIFRAPVGQVRDVVNRGKR